MVALRLRLAALARAAKPKRSAVAAVVAAKAASPTAAARLRSSIAFDTEIMEP